MSHFEKVHRLPMPPKSEKPTPDYLHYRVDGVHLGAVLAARRQSMGLSMQELADRAAVSPTTVMKLEHGEITVQFDKFLQIVDQLGIPLSAIVGFEKDGPEQLPDLFIQRVIVKLTGRQLEDALLLLATELARRKSPSKD